MKNYIKDGLIIVNKPKGLTSHDVVEEIRNLFPKVKVGHTGTLDPLATGVLLVCIGKATKLSQILVKYSKEYVTEIELGYETDTLDSYGEIVKRLSKDELSSRLENININNIKEKNKIIVVKNFKSYHKSLKKVLDSFVGEIDQVPPIYSAIKLKGKELYKIARKNEKVEIKPKKVKIYKIQLIDTIKNSIFKIKVNCSSGTYIRALARDIGIKLKTYATLTNLVRTRIGNYKIEDSYKLEQLENLALMKRINEIVIPISEFLRIYKKVKIKDFFKKMIENGAPLSLNMIKNIPFICKKEETIIIYTNTKKSISLYKTVRDINLDTESNSKMVVAKAWIMLN